MSGSGDRLALVGDIHGNLAALRAVVRAIEDAGITRGACTGDLVMRGPDPVGVVKTIRALGWPAVAGNTDIRVAGNRELGIPVEPPRPRSHPASRRAGSRSWTIREIGKGAREYLNRLPMTARLEVGGHSVALVHAGPRDATERVEHDTDRGRLRELAAELGAECVVTGHTHHPHLIEVDGVLFVNPGPVGESRDLDLRPRWAWLSAGPEGLDVHFEIVERPLAMTRAAGGPGG